LFFRAGETNTGSELWKSDGTEGGTVIVKDINPGTGSSAPFWFEGIGNTLLFGAIDGIHGQELWATDGTDSGTVMVKDINPGIGNGFVD
jgi:ELWxxDGT repeat protein